MKKVSRILVVLMLALLVVPAFTGCAPRDEILRIYNWGDYIDESILDDFEDYYANATKSEEYPDGKKITVKYSTFDSNEALYTKYKNKRLPDYDLIVPSEYLVQQMLQEDLLQSFSKNADGSYKYLTNFNNVYDNLRGETYTAGGTTYNFDDYAVPYMWGTVGIIYNVDKVSPDLVKTWSAVMNPIGNPNSGKISMKDSVRDSYLVANIYNNRTTLKALFDAGDKDAHKAKVQEVIDDVSPAAIAAARTALSAQKSILKSYESDIGKEDMVSESLNLGTVYSGDAVWAFEEAFDINKVNLAYYVPEEGSNVWTDYFVMPKAAKNTEAAEIFLNYICEVDIATRNIEESGYTSAIEEACENVKHDISNDTQKWAASKFSGYADIGGKSYLEWYKEMYLEALFPGDDTLARCGVMKYFGDATSAIDDMWREIRY